MSCCSLNSNLAPICEWYVVNNVNKVININDTKRTQICLKTPFCTAQAMFVLWEWPETRFCH